MNIDPEQAYREWAAGTREPFNAKDAYLAGYEFAQRVRDEERRREEHPVVKNLQHIKDMLGRGPF